MAKFSRTFNTLYWRHESRKLYYGLYDYIENKSYNTTFGDLVPEITARALGMGIVVIHKQGNDDIMRAIYNRDNPGEMIYVYYHKNDEHYDGTIRFC